MYFTDVSERVLREFERRNLVLGFLLTLVVWVMFREPKLVGNVLFGVFLHSLLFQHLKRDGWKIAAQALAGVAYGKILRNFLLRYYFRLLGVGILLGILFRMKVLDPIFFCLGLSVPVMQLFLILTELIVKKAYFIGSREV